MALRQHPAGTDGLQCFLTLASEMIHFCLLRVEAPQVLEDECEVSFMLPPGSGLSFETTAPSAAKHRFPLARCYLRTTRAKSHSSPSWRTMFGLQTRHSQSSLAICFFQGESADSHFQTPSCFILQYNFISIPPRVRCRSKYLQFGSYEYYARPSH